MGSKWGETGMLLRTNEAQLPRTAGTARGCGIRRRIPRLPREHDVVAFAPTANIRRVSSDSAPSDSAGERGYNGSVRSMEAQGKSRNCTRTRRSCCLIWLENRATLHAKLAAEHRKQHNGWQSHNQEIRTCYENHSHYSPRDGRGIDGDDRAGVGHVQG
jgi:hypothetical protein